MTRQLAALGATVYIGHAADHLGPEEDADLEAVIVSSAVAADNPEVLEAHRRGVPVYKRADWLRRISMERKLRCVAVAGTHGKTTTTAMITFIAYQMNLQPTFIVGGTLRQLGTNAGAGSGDIFIIEADEYDHMFLGLYPEIAVITTVEWDHPDCYPTPNSMRDAFVQFVGHVSKEGCIIACVDDVGVREVIEHARRSGQLHTHLNTYGLLPEAHWQARNLHLNERGSYDFEVVCGGRSVGMVSLQVPGIHNIRNALGAMVAAEHLGVSPQHIAAALSQFAGVERRFERKGEVGGVIVFDDYAHHPTEIRTVLATARMVYGRRPLWAVFQPHTYSRTRALLDEFTQSFTDADHVIVLDIFAAREAQNEGISGALIAEHAVHPDVHYIGGIEQAAEYVLEHIEPDAVLITLGAGDGYRVGEQVLEGLRHRVHW
jgi:UDP-N-acetylmuramate--alanine ligase